MVPQSDIQSAVEAAKGETKSRQAHRLADYLVVNDSALTGDIARDLAIGNISAAANILRPALEKRGYTIIANMPEKPIRNRFGDPSMSHEWRLVRIH